MISKKESRRSLDSGYRKYDTDACFYCGDEGSSWDHAWPASGDKALAPEEMMVMVRCCVECNGIASNRCFMTLAEKRAFIQGHLERKYKKILAMPNWSGEEISELGRGLQDQVHAGLRLKYAIQNRVRYQH